MYPFSSVFIASTLAVFSQLGLAQFPPKLEELGHKVVQSKFHEGISISYKKEASEAIYICSSSPRLPMITKLHYQ